MRKGLVGVLWASVLVLAILLAACDEVEPEAAPSADQGSGVAQLPTRTVKPIVSFTPRFTATPLPSATFTPSVTPSPTASIVPPTLTPTTPPSPTPTVSGVIQSTSSRVNLRSGPGFDQDIAASVPPNTTLGVVGFQTDPEGLGWYKVAYTDEDGATQLLWVRSTLVSTDYDEVVAAPTDSPALAVNDGAGDDPGTTAASSPTPGATPEPERIDILAYCRQKNVNPPAVNTNDTVYVEWSWFVAREELMQQHLDNANYQVRLDGELLEDWERFGTELKRESGVWIIYWYYPVGQLAAGEHKVTYLLTWDEPISDGYEDFGPGTAIETNEGNCVFTVAEAGS